MLRKLSPSERMDMLLAADFANVFAVTARVRGHCAPDELERAIQVASARHPQLRVRVVRGPAARLSSIGVPPPPLRVAPAGTRWEAAVAAELQQPFELRHGPLTRFVLIPGAESFDLLAVTSHLIADGRALVYLLGDLLRQLAGLPVPPGVVEPPSPWQLVDTRPDPAPTPPPPRPPADRPDRAEPAEAEHRPAGPFEVLAASLDERRTSALVRRCHEESTTVHAALCIAFARGLADAVPGSATRRLGCPFSLRELLPPEATDAFGSYQGPPAQLTVQAGSPADFWAEARELKAELNRQTAPASLRLAIRYLRVLTLLPNPVARRLLRKLIADDPDLWISNLGELPIPRRYQELELIELRLAVHTGPPDRRILGVTKTGGRLLFTIACADRPAMEQMIRCAVEQLDRALDIRVSDAQPPLSDAHRPEVGRPAEVQPEGPVEGRPPIQRPGP